MNQYQSGKTKTTRKTPDATLTRVGSRKQLRLSGENITIVDQQEVDSLKARVDNLENTIRKLNNVIIQQQANIQRLATEISSIKTRRTR